MIATRAPAVAGTFYPGSAKELARTVDALLGEVAPSKGPLPKAIIVPHAGYVYSGPIAASAYAKLIPHAAQIRRVVLIGPAHRAYVDGLASADASAFATPLGEVRVDMACLEHAPTVLPDARAHAREHSLEVQLPFLQRVVPDAEIVPMVVGDASPEEVATVLEALWGGPETVIVVSSDLSHYLPYAIGRAADRSTAQRVCRLDPTPVSPEEACGCRGINGLLRVAAAKGMRVELLDLRSSGDTAGPRAEVVGYGAFAFYGSAS